MDVVALLFCFLYTYYHSSRKPQCVKLRVRAEPDEPKALLCVSLYFEHFSHRFLTLDYNSVGIMHDAVTDCIGNDWRANLIPPAWYIKLGTEDD